MMSNTILLPLIAHLHALSSGSREEPCFGAWKGPSDANRNTKVFPSCSLSLSLPPSLLVLKSERAKELKGRKSVHLLANASPSLSCSDAHALHGI